MPGSNPIANEAYAAAAQNTGTFNDPSALYNPAAYGSNPSIPTASASQPGAISGNIGELGALYGLSTGVGSASAAGQAAQYNANLPGYQNLMTTASGDIQNELEGQLSPDVINQITESAAERGVATGAPGGPNGNAAYLKALGLTSLGLEEQGQQDLTAAIGRTPVGPAFNPASMLVTPGEQQSSAAQAAIAAAQPNGLAAAMANMAAARAGLNTGAGGGGATVSGPGNAGGGEAPLDLSEPGSSPTLTATGTGFDYSTSLNSLGGMNYGATGTGTPYIGANPDTTPMDPSSPTYGSQMNSYFPGLQLPEGAFPTNPQANTTPDYGLGDEAGGQPASASAGGDPLAGIYSDMGFDPSDF